MTDLNETTRAMMDRVLLLRTFDPAMFVPEDATFQEAIDVLKAISPFCEEAWSRDRGSPQRWQLTWDARRQRMRTIPDGDLQRLVESTPIPADDAFARFLGAAVTGKGVPELDEVGELSQNDCWELRAALQFARSANRLSAIVTPELEQAVDDVLTQHLKPVEAEDEPTGSYGIR